LSANSLCCSSADWLLKCKPGCWPALLPGMD
jgi:hypothetical protein